MLLVFDIGNTNITFGIYNKKTLIFRESIPTILDKTIDEYAIDLIEIFLNQKIDCIRIENVLIGSVVPSLNNTIKDAVKKFATESTKIKIIGQNKIKFNIINKSTKQNEVGHDRLINSVAAFDKYRNNLIIIDLGTAVTFDVVSKEGCYFGGIIFPGLNISLKALHENTSKLPLLRLSKPPKKVIGRCTDEAILSGIYNGYNAMIEGVIAKIENEYGSNMQKIFTGGQAIFFKDLIKKINAYLDVDLTLRGLRILHENNTKNNES